MSRLLISAGFLVAAAVLATRSYHYHISDLRQQQWEEFRRHIIGGVFEHFNYSSWSTWCLIGSILSTIVALLFLVSFIISRYRK
jgi:hypothetical protein